MTDHQTEIFHNPPVDPLPAGAVPIVTAAGSCAPMAGPLRDLFLVTPELNPSGLARAARAVNRDQSDEDIASAVIAAYHATPVEDAFPPVSAPRGGIVFRRPDTWAPPKPARFPKLARARLTARRRVAKTRAFVRRAQDARAVLAGLKHAHTDAELEAIAEDWP